LADDLLVSEINIPEKINIDSSDVLPSLEELVNDNFTQSEVSEPVTNKDLSAEEMEKVMNDIETTVNFTSIDESMHALNNPEILLNRIQNAFNTFKEKTGRQMTYSEMRYMMG
jgi:Ca2+-binding EF-hand superfamily protein